MAAASSTIEAQHLAVDEECAALVHEPAVRPRSIWRIAAGVAVASALVVAGALKTGSIKTVVGDGVTGLETVTFTYGTVFELGCNNWAHMEITRSNGTSIEECKQQCNEDPTCTMLNYQADPCEPGWYASEGCMLFKGECQPTANKCWSLSYKFISTTP